MQVEVKNNPITTIILSAAEVHSIFTDFFDIAMDGNISPHTKKFLECIMAADQRDNSEEIGAII